MMEFEFITELTADIVNSLHIHSTFSSLRRARANRRFEEVEATEELPTLTYIIKRDEQSGEEVQEIHALSVDITRFLMLKSLGSSTSDEVTEGDSENA